MSTEAKIAAKVVRQFEEARIDEHPTRKAKQLAEASFQGALKIAAVALDAMTPFQIEVALIDFQSERPRPYPFTPVTWGNTVKLEYRRWAEDAEAAVLGVVGISPIVADAEYLGIKYLAAGDQVAFNTKENRPRRSDLRTVTAVHPQGARKAIYIDGHLFDTFGSATKLWQVQAPENRGSNAGRAAALAGSVG